MSLVFNLLDTSAHKLKKSFLKSLCPPFHSLRLTDSQITLHYYPSTKFTSSKSPKLSLSEHAGSLVVKGSRVPISEDGSLSSCGNYVRENFSQRKICLSLLNGVVERSEAKSKF